MFVFSPSSQLALRTANQDLSFTALERVIREIEFDFKALGTETVLAVPVSNSLQSLAVVLRALQEKIPVALFDPSLSNSEKTKKLQLLRRSFDWETQVLSSTNARLNLHSLTRLILLTSGSSGKPKAVQLSNENISANRNAVIESLNFNTVTEQHLFLPLSYSFGFLGQLLPALHLQIPTNLYLDFADFFRSNSWQSCRGMISGVPAHFETLVRAMKTPNPNVTHVVSAGARLSLPLREKMRELFPRATLFNNYGQTEASPRILSFSSQDPQFLTDAVGRPIGDWKARLDTEGRLEVSGSQVMLGYTDPQLVSVLQIEGEQIWLKTGDLALIRDDGLVEIKGRLDDLVKIGGERVSLLELEADFKRVLQLDQLAVLTQEDPIRGLVLILVLENSDRTDGEVRQVLAGQWGGARLPRSVVRLESLPRLVNGKLDRMSLRKLFS